jgi:hypothetical protein
LLPQHVLHKNASVLAKASAVAVVADGAAEKEEVAETVPAGNTSGSYRVSFHETFNKQGDFLPAFFI